MVGLPWGNPNMYGSENGKTKKGNSKDRGNPTRHSRFATNDEPCYAQNNCQARRERGYNRAQKSSSIGRGESHVLRVGLGGN